MGYKSNSPQVHSPEVLESQLANSKCVCAAIEQQKNRQDGDASQGVQYLRRSDYRYTRRYAVSQPAPPPRIGSTLTIFSCHPASVSTSRPCPRSTSLNNTWTTLTIPPALSRVPSVQPLPLVLLLVPWPPGPAPTNGAEEIPSGSPTCSGSSEQLSRSAARTGAP